MFEIPKLVVMILVFAAVWIGYRWLAGPARELPRRVPDQALLLGQEVHVSKFLFNGRSRRPAASRKL